MRGVGVVRALVTAGLIAATALKSASAAPVSVSDDAGAIIRLAQPARRIVTLAPHLAETLDAAGARSRLVGVVDFSDFPTPVAQLPHVGSYARLDLEAIVALKPDLVIGWQSGNAPAQIDKLRALGIPVYLSQPNRIEDIAREIERFGVLAETSETAQTAAAQFRARLASIDRRFSRQPAVRSFYQIWPAPLMTVGGRQIISDVLRRCGGENVFGQLETFAPTVTTEAVIAADPEAIIASGMGDSRPEWLDAWKRWPTLTAVQRDNLYFVPPELLQRHTPRLLDGAERLCAALEQARRKRPGRP